MYSNEPVMPRSESAKPTVRSNLAATFAGGNGVTRTLGSVTGDALGGAVVRDPDEHDIPACALDEGGDLSRIFPVATVVRDRLTRRVSTGSEVSARLGADPLQLAAELPLIEDEAGYVAAARAPNTLRDYRQ